MRGPLQVAPCIREDGRQLEQLVPRVGDDGVGLGARAYEQAVRGPQREVAVRHQLVEPQLLDLVQPRLQVGAKQARVDRLDPVERLCVERTQGVEQLPVAVGCRGVLLGGVGLDPDLAGLCHQVRERGAFALIRGSQQEQDRRHESRHEHHLSVRRGASAYRAATRCGPNRSRCGQRSCPGHVSSRFRAASGL